MSSDWDEDWAEPEETRTRLILEFPPSLPDLSRESFELDNLAAFLIDFSTGHLEPLGELAASLGKALIVRPGDASSLPNFVNGCEIAGASDVPRWRERMGPNFIIGARIGTSRHDAMVAGEAGADYVVFHDNEGVAGVAATVAELCRWWSDVMVLPCAVDGVRTTNKARMLASSGADFVIVGDAIWASASPARSLAEFCRVVTEACEI